MSAQAPAVDDGAKPATELTIEERAAHPVVPAGWPALADVRRDLEDAGMPGVELWLSTKDPAFGNTAYLITMAGSIVGRVTTRGTILPSFFSKFPPYEALRRSFHAIGAALGVQFDPRRLDDLLTCPTLAEVLDNLASALEEGVSAGEVEIPRATTVPDSVHRIIGVAAEAQDAYCEASRLLQQIFEMFYIQVPADPDMSPIDKLRAAFADLDAQANRDGPRNLDDA